MAGRDKIGGVEYDVVPDLKFDDFDKDLKDRLEKVGKEHEKAGEKHADQYGKGFEKSAAKGKVQDSIAKGLRKSSPALNRAAAKVGSDTGDKVQQQLAKSLSKSNVKLGRAVQGIGREAAADIQKSIAKGLSDPDASLTKAVRGLGRQTGDSIGAEIKAGIAFRLRRPDARLTTAVRQIGTDAGNTFSASMVEASDRSLKGDLVNLFKRLGPRIRSASSDGGRDGGRTFGFAFGDGFGDVFAKALGQQFYKGLPRFYKTIIKALPFIVEPIAVGLQGLGGGLLAVGSTALQATPALGGLIPVATGLAASIVPLVVGFDGVGSALGAMTSELADAAKEGRAFNLAADDIQKSLRGLSPAAREFALAFGAILPQFQEFKTAVQERLFAGLGEQLTQFAESALPGLSAGFLALTDSLNAVFSDLLGRLGGFDFEGLLGGLAPVIENLGKAFNDLILAFLTFSQAATPAASVLVDLFRQMTDGLLQWTQAGLESGSISEGIGRAIGPLRTIWDLIKSASSALFTLSDIGDQTGQSLIRSLQAQIDKWNEWMQTVEGENAVRDFFELSAESLRAFTPLLKGLQEAFSILVTPETVERFSQFLDSLGQLLPILAEIFVVVGNLGILNLIADLFLLIGEAIRPLLPILGEITTLIGNTLAQVLQTLSPLLEGIAEVFGALLTAVQPLLGPLTEVALVFAETLVGALVALLPAILALLEPLLGLVETMVPLFQRLMNEALLPLIEALGPVLGEVLIALTPLLDVIVMLFTQSSGIIIELVIVVVQLVTALLPLLPLIAQIIGLFANIVATVLGAVLPAFSAVISIVASEIGRAHV